jgi:hypothetical protein
MKSKPSIIPLIIRELTQSFFGFFSDWYLKAPKAYLKKVRASFKSWERTWALEITIKNWLTPLYQDYTPVGYFVGVGARTVRIFLALIFYFFFFVFVLLGLLAWLVFPFFLLGMVFLNLI